MLRLNLIFSPVLDNIFRFKYAAMRLVNRFVSDTCSLYSLAGG